MEMTHQEAWDKLMLICKHYHVQLDLEDIDDEEPDPNGWEARVSGGDCN